VRVEDTPYLPASDGLLARKSGDWAKRKHYYLRNYCGITTRSMHQKWRLVYLDVMAGPGLCKIEETGEEFPGSPLVALEHGFEEFIFIEDNPRLADALEQRVSRHRKTSLVKVIRENWVEVVEQGRLRFSDGTLVVAFVDPTGISQVPMGWREWKWKEASEFARMAIDAFSQRIQQEGFIGTRHISVPQDQPLYRFTLFSRHPLAETFWTKILKIDETGQRELL
jgi:hypothetical protein